MIALSLRVVSATCKGVCQVLLPSVALMLFPAASEADFTFTPLGDLAGGAFQSSANGVSADGSVVVGLAESASGSEAFRWTLGTGMVGLGVLPGPSFLSAATATSADGSVVVGFSTSGNTTEAFRWTAADGMVGIGFELGPPEFTSQSLAHAVSADGSVIAGQTRFASLRSSRWTAADGWVVLTDGGALGISPDGSMVVGSHNGDQSGQEAYLWTAGGGILNLGDLAGGSVDAGALDLSADGSVVVGVGRSGNGREAFRWTSENGMQGLGDLQGGFFSSTALAISQNGLIVVGQSETEVGNEAFLWTQSTGMIDLKDLLIAHGVTNLDGWHLRSGIDISADGTTIVGRGTNPFGDAEAWVVTIDTAVVPETSTLLLVSVGYLGLSIRRNKRFRVITGW